MQCPPLLATGGNSHPTTSAHVLAHVVDRSLTRRNLCDSHARPPHPALSKTRSSQVSRACAFCGRAADSREHLFPDWLRKVLPSEEQMLHFRQIGKDGATRHEWSSRPFVDKVRFVCSRCNSVWMSLLEQRAQPLLRPPITRTPCAFTTPQQIVLASGRPRPPSSSRRVRPTSR